MQITINNCIECKNPPLVDYVNNKEQFVITCIIPDCHSVEVAGPSFTRARLGWNNLNATCKESLQIEPVGIPD